MKLIKKIKETGYVGAGASTAMMSINSYGSIRFSKKFVEEANLSKGVKLNFYESAENKKRWHLAIEKDGEYELTGNSKDKISFTNKSLEREIRQKFEQPSGTIKFKIGELFLHKYESSVVKIYPLELIVPKETQQNK